MGSEGSSRRPFCIRCSKPARICLCDRFKSPPIDNSIAITILQHSLEKTHPLNSSRVARIGLKNLRVIPVTDVIFEAQFLIRPLEPNKDHASSQIGQNRYEESTPNGFVVPQSPSERLGFRSGMPESVERFDLSQDLSSSSNDYGQIGDIRVDDEVRSSFSKYSVTYSSKYIMVAIERTAKPEIGWILNCPVGRTAISNGFMVRKLQREKLLQSSEGFKDFEEFNLVIPPRSVLLFPNSNAIELAEVDYEVQHLIVLDGTWAKARRMYYENPWLKLLPHLKLDQRGESLYSEVRHQPKEGYLSTIESIVYALKGLGNDMEGLDEILEVFESMIKDQRRCKDEKFRAMSKS